MNQGPLYSSKIKKSKRISNNNIRTNNVYKLISYKYTNGSIESDSSPRASLIFIFGIYEKDVHAIKLNMVKPDAFFRWLKTSSAKVVTQEMLNNSDLPSLLKESDESGKSFFVSNIKGKSIYKIEPRAYRTYKLPNIKNIEEVEFKESFLETIFGKPNRTKEEIKDSTKVEKVEAKEKITPTEINTVDKSMDDFVNQTLDILNK